MTYKSKLQIPDRVVSREEAKLSGLSWYFTGKPCQRGHLSTRNVASFGCHQCVQEIRAKKRNRPKAFDLKGQVFGRLCVVDEHSRGNGVKWLCRCDCGNDTVVKAGHLRAGAVKSCGCLAKEVAAKTAIDTAHLRRKHGMSRSRLDDMFDNMIARCEKPSNERWERYGARGIAICHEWRSNRGRFFEWALQNGYADDLTIDRIDNDGNYGPENCRFVDAYIQQNNTSRNVVITVGLVSRTIANWARFLGVTYSSVQHRYDRGWPPERIVGQPFRSGHLPNGGVPE